LNLDRIISETGQNLANDLCGFDLNLDVGKRISDTAAKRQLMPVWLNNPPNPLLIPFFTAYENLISSISHEYIIELCRNASKTTMMDRPNILGSDIQ